MKIHRCLQTTLLISLLCLAGCGSKDTPRVQVTGQIKYQGKALTVGTISFVGDGTNAVAEGTIKDGKYTVERAPVGSVKIGVITPTPPSKQQMMQKVEGKSGGSSVNIVPVPGKFANPDKSGLTYTVTTASPQTYDIDLK